MIKVNKKIKRISSLVAFLLIIPMVIPLVQSPPPPPTETFTVSHIYAGDIIDCIKEGEWNPTYKIQIVDMDDVHVKIMKYVGDGSECDPDYTPTEADIGYSSDYIIDANSTLVFEKVSGSFGVQSVKCVVTADVNYYKIVSLGSSSSCEFTVSEGESVTVAEKKGWRNTVKLTLKKIEEHFITLEVDINDGDTIVENFRIGRREKLYNPPDLGDFVIFWYDLGENEDEVIFYFNYVSKYTDIYAGEQEEEEEHDKKNVIKWLDKRPEGYIILDAPEQTKKVPATLNIEYTGSDLIDRVKVKWINPNTEINLEDYVTDPVLHTTLLGGAVETSTITFDMCFATSEYDWVMFTLQVYQNVQPATILGEVSVWLSRVEPSYILEMEAPSENYTNRTWIFTLKKGNETASIEDITRIEVNGEPQEIENPFSFTPTEAKQYQIYYRAGSWTDSKIIFPKEEPYTPSYVIQSSTLSPKIGDTVTITVLDQGGRAVLPADVTSLTFSGAYNHTYTNETTVQLTITEMGSITVNAVVKGVALTPITITPKKPTIEMQALQIKNESKIQVKLIKPEKGEVKITYAGGTVVDYTPISRGETAIYDVPVANEIYTVKIRDPEDIYDTSSKNVTVTIKEAKKDLDYYCSAGYNPNTNKIWSDTGEITGVEITYYYRKDKGSRYKEITDLDDPEEGDYKVVFEKGEDEFIETFTVDKPSRFHMSMKTILIILGIVGGVAAVLLYIFKFRGQSIKPPTKEVEASKPVLEKEKVAEAKKGIGHLVSGDKQI